MAAGRREREGQAAHENPLIRGLLKSLPPAPVDLARRANDVANGAIGGGRQGAGQPPIVGNLEARLPLALAGFWGP